MENQVKRYGTSCAEREDGCFVRYEDYKALLSEVNAWRAASAVIKQQLATAQAHYTETDK